MLYVYTAPNCKPCKVLKDSFDEAGVSYEERSLMDFVEEVVELGAKSAPAVVKEGKLLSKIEVQQLIGAV